MEAIASSPLNRIWQIRGELPLVPGLSSDEAFGRLDPLFREVGTTRERRGDTLTFRKQDQTPQDPLSVFDAGTLQIEPETGGAVLRYQMTSRFLLFSFLAPLLFLAFAGLTIAVARFQDPPTVGELKKQEEAKNRVLPQHPIDKFLGAPAPELPKQDDKAKSGDKAKGDKAKDEDKGPKPTAAYVLAAIFAVLYAVGRVLEAWLVKRLFKKRLLDS